MGNVSEIEKLEKELKKLEEKHGEQDKKFWEKKREIQDKIKSLKEDEAKEKLGEKFYNKVVHITRAVPYYGIQEHYIGIINPDTVCSQGFYMYKNALYVRMDNNTVTYIRLEEYDNCDVKVNPYELFKNESVTYGDDTPRNEKEIITIKLASQKEDTDFIQQAFKTKKNQYISQMDKLKDFCISMLQ